MCIILQKVCKCIIYIGDIVYFRNINVKQNNIYMGCLISQIKFNFMLNLFLFFVVLKIMNCSLYRIFEVLEVIISKFIISNWVYI